MKLAHLVLRLPDSTAVFRRSLPAVRAMSRFPAVNTPMLPGETFSGRVALVTGGGTGLGRAMATMLSKLGADVAIASRRINVLEATASEISAETGGRVLPVQMDVRDSNNVSEAVDSVVEQLGLPTVIVNNAAGNFISPFERLSPNAFKTVVDIVLNGTANVTLDIGKRLIAKELGGTFLSITTWYAEAGSSYVVPSACAKAGVETMTKSLAAEWAKYGCRFNCIAPGPFYTEGAFSRLLPSDDVTGLMKNKVPVGRLGETEELANLACYLLSDYASFMNGEVVVFDGGERREFSGMFNAFHAVSNEQWDLVEQAIRAGNKKSKL